MIFVGHVWETYFAPPNPMLTHLASFSMSLALGSFTLVLCRALCVVEGAFFLELLLLLLLFVGVSLLCSSKLIAVCVLDLPLPNFCLLELVCMV